MVEPFGSGLINNTWKVTVPGRAYILQKINQEVFKHPQDIAENIRLVGDYLKQHQPGYLFVAPVASREGTSLVWLEGSGAFRLFPFVEGSFSKNIAETPAEAYEAAAQFGRFTRLLNGFAVNTLKVTIPSFHDLSLRYEQFILSLEKGNQRRVIAASSLIKMAIQWSDIVAEYQRITTDPAFKLRVTHHDTKISNVLFDESGEGLCVVDLDTIMPGYFISDMGDMMRTYLSPVDEEEKDFSKIQVRNDFYHAIVDGYCREMKDVLTNKEKEHFFYAGTFMIYMQMLRFLTDYINNDKYYGERYPGHNLVRAGNQATLFQRLVEKEHFLK